MKKMILIALLLACFSLLFPILFALQNPAAAASAEEPTSSPSPAPAAATAAVSNSLTYTATTGSDATVTVRVLIDGFVTILPLDSYLTGVVAAEMPASFETEALQAQAIAARTYTFYKMLVAPSSNHPDADMCDDINCCKAYNSLQELKTIWGDTYEQNIAKIRTAVSATDGQFLTYQDTPALAVFHSSSGGYTEDSQHVWGTAVPYLVSVKSPENAEVVPNFVSTVSVTPEDFRDTLAAVYPDMDLSGDPTQWMENAVYYSSGRLDQITIGGVAVSGTALRELFALRSAAITLKATDSDVTFTVTGYGHGVGMSQYGANDLAQDGYTYAEILAHYYPGTQLASAADTLDFSDDR